MKKLKTLLALLCAAALLSPLGAVCFAEEAEDAPLDYSLAENWVYYETDAEREVDVFLVCPVVDTKSATNAFDLNEKLKKRFVSALESERGLYEETGRIFSPYYRQMSINAYLLPEEQHAIARQIAYRDVAAAFRWYLEHENAGRGIILAGFSQGGDMCQELTKEFFADEEAREQLIAVYSIGWCLKGEDAAQYPQLRLAEGETDTGVVICYDCEDGTVSGTIVIPEGEKVLSINPLNWRTDDTPADKSLNRGALFSGEDAPVEGFCGAVIGERGQLIVTDIDASDYPPGLAVFPEGALHLYDITFFYTNVKDNVAVRTAAWAAQHEELPAAA